MTLLGHAGGTGWDEITLAVLPFLLSGAIFVMARRNTGPKTKSDLTAPVKAVSQGSPVT